MNLKNALIALHQRPIAYYPVYRKITGSTTAGVLLSQIMYWYAKVGRKFYKTDAEVMEETMLTEGELRTAKNRLKKLDFVKITRQGVPARTFYNINTALLFDQISQSSFVESTNLDLSNQQDSDCNINETNTETTHETSSGEHTHTSSLPVPQSSEEVKNQILNASIHTDSIENRIAVWKIVEPYLSTESFKQQWQFMNAGTVNANDLMKEWVTKADWFDVQNFRINRMTGWIKNYKRPAQNSYRGKYTLPPQDTTYTPPVTTTRARQSVPVISPEEMARIREERRVN